jgi:hypothetical protein
MKTKTIESKTEDPAQVRVEMIKIAQKHGKVKSVSANGHGPIAIILDISGQRKYEQDIAVDPETGVITLYFDKSHGPAMDLLSQYRKLECLNGTRERLRIDSSIAYPY